MDLHELSARLDRLAFPARRRMLADIARALAGSAELTALLGELDARPGVTRAWAMTMASIAGEQAYLRRSLTSSDLSVAGSAVRYCVRTGSHLDAVVDVLPTAPMAWRQSLYRGLRAGSRTDWATRLIPTVRARFGAHEAAALLPACDANTIAALLPELDFAVANLSSLARREPEVVLAHLRGLLAASSEGERTAVWRRYAATIGALVAHDAEQILALLETHGPLTGLPPGEGGWLVALAKADPDRLIALLAEPGRHPHFVLSHGLCAALAGASDDSLALLARSLFHPGNGTRLALLLRKLPPSRRGRIFASALGGQDLIQAGLLPSLLDDLPWRARHEQAQALLATRTVADRQDVRLNISARLPWAQAEPVLRAETTKSTADTRAIGYHLLIGAAAATRDPVVVAELLASLTRLTNEQDPVRGAALSALARIPAWLFRPDDVPLLVTIAQDALQARDISWHTRQAVQTLAGRLVGHGASTAQPPILDGGLRIIELAGSSASNVSFFGIDRNLPRGAEHEVFRVLRARIVADARAGRYGLALSLASGLGRRAWAVAELQDHVKAALTAAADHTVQQAIGLWLEPRATRDDRVEAVLRKDPSTVIVPSVANAISRRRTDLLDRVLAGRLRGRFVKRGISPVPIFADSLSRWLPRQLARYADLLTDIATAPNKAVWERVTAVRRLGRLPGIGADAVRPFLSDREVSVVETALAALAWTEQPGDVLGELLGYADTDRARVAVYAATRCARSVSPDRLVDALRPVLSGGKVTSRKEAIRLLAEHRGPGAVTELLALWADPRLHRDIRRSIVSAVRRLLDDERVWTILTDAATAEPVVAAALTEADPYTVGLSHRARYGALVRAVGAHPDVETSRGGLSAWPRWSAWDRDGGTALVALSCDLDETARWQTALDALVDACAISSDTASLATVADTLSTLPDIQTPDRDLPARQRLLRLVELVTSRIDQAGESMRAAAVALAEILATAPDQRTTALRLAVAALPRHGDLLAPLRRIAELAERPLLAWKVADMLVEWIIRHDRDRPDLLATARELTSNPGGAQLALAIAGAAGPHSGWSAPWRNLVVAQRTNADPDVRERALRIYLTPE
jgi:hypothetical protein